MNTVSAIYEGWVRHRRRKPVAHAFRYPLYMSYLNLAEVERQEGMTARTRHFSRWIRGFHREDHFGDPALPLSECVRDLAATEIGERPHGAVCALTHLRHAGYVMNPVSFFYCWDEAGSRVLAIVAEIHNTPWGETFCYVLDTRRSDAMIQREFSKRFHVSPFMGMNQEYRWRFSHPSEKIVVHMENLEAEESIFDATLTLRRTPPTPKALAFVWRRHALMTHKVIASIYLQAFRLWMKRCPYHAHPRKSGTKGAAK